MSIYSIRELASKEFPPLLSQINDAPKKLFCAGNLPSAEEKILSIVGSRKYSEYGKEACEKLIAGLKGFPITIVSGLALGIDSIAHRAALKHKIRTVAIPGSGLDPKVLYPASHVRLAEKIIASGGGLLSEFENDFKATTWSFPQRNRIMAGISHAVLVIEAELKSGTLITSKLATEYNRDVLAVPGSIFSKNSEGPHMLIRLGATPIRSSEEILEALGFKIEDKNNKTLFDDLPEDEKIIVDLLKSPMTRDEIIKSMALPAYKVNILLSSMELKGLTKESMGEIRLV